MKELKKALNCFLLITVICCTPCFAAEGGKIDKVVIENGNPAKVIVTSVFPDNCSMAAEAITTVFGNLVIVQVFTGEPESPCETGVLKISREFTPPLSNEYELLTLLYDGIPFSSTAMLLDNETIQVVQETDVCSTTCREIYSQCSDNCSDDLKACTNDCDNDSLCLDKCNEDFDVCEDNCTKKFGTCKEDCIPDARLEINPETLNLKSNGRWITAHLIPPVGYVTGDINMESVLLENEIKPDWYMVMGGYVMIKFSRQAVVDYIKETHDVYPSDIDLTVSGVLLDDIATAFTATDTIHVINPGKGKGDKEKGNNDDDDKDKGGKTK